MIWYERRMNMDFAEKVAYLKGLAEGLAEGRSEILNQVNNLLNSCKSDSELIESLNKLVKNFEKEN